MTLVIITGEIDLSVASVVGLSSVLARRAAPTHGMVDPVRGLARPRWSALLCGAFNGFLVAYVGLPSLAVTIGTLALFRGHRGRAARHQGGHRLPREVDRPRQRHEIGETGIPLMMVAVRRARRRLRAAAALLAFGRGDLRHRAEHRGGALHRRQRASAPSSCCSCCPASVSAFAGIYCTLRFGSARGDNATGLELQVIAAVLLGGVSIFGGRGAAARRHRRRPADRRHLQRAAPARA